MSQFNDGYNPHVHTERLAAFLVDGIPLAPMERGHVRQCKHCLHSMAAAACEELKRRRSGAQLSRIHMAGEHVRH